MTKSPTNGSLTHDDEFLLNKSVKDDSPENTAENKGLIGGLLKNPLGNMGKNLTQGVMTFHKNINIFG
jgi:hypothetical protein